MIWASTGYKAGMAILDLLSKFLTRHHIHLQWVPPYVGFSGNKTTNDLDKVAYTDRVDHDQ